MTPEENLADLKRSAELLALLDRRRSDRLLAAWTSQYVALIALTAETQKDKDEYMEEMSLGGRRYRERR